ncbi:MAG: 4-alpha-glucanotransferase [Nitrospirae bacterium]|nr:4-alpha-glucanotransferase [Nitrospirota bacterium]
MDQSPFIKRQSGILLHVTSLPSSYGIGDLGPGARRFVDFLAEAGQSLWQILPLTPTCGIYGHSPYSSFSAFACNKLLISPEMLVSDGIISKTELPPAPRCRKGRVNYKTAGRYKEKILDTAFEKKRNSLGEDERFERFCLENSEWLEDYCLFISIKKKMRGLVWSRWPVELRDRDEGTLRELATRMSDEILKEKFYQYLFSLQWQSLKKYCEDRKVSIIGDIPIYVNHDSADVWANPGIFRLDKDKNPYLVAGVPPDYFSETGQLWGHPVYNWDALRESGYSWWIKRIEHNLKLVHIFRIDHFRGFAGYWAVDAKDKNAVNGVWMKAPADDFFNTLQNYFKRLPVIAEDLGTITPDVSEVMKKFGFPGMKVLLFAFGDDLPSNPYAPHNHIQNCVVYTGTHDNNTIKGWFRKEADAGVRKRLSDYTGKKASLKTVHRDIIRMAVSSVANTAIIPMQDMLGMDERGRMNLPATIKGNWGWMLSDKQLSTSLANELKDMTKLYGRASV